MNRFLFLSLLALCVAACTPKRPLFEGGRSEYCIVIGKDASPIERYAARELQTRIREVSGPLNFLNWIGSALNKTRR